MADSRRASTSKIRISERVVQSQSRMIQFMGSILLSLLLTFVIKDDSFGSPQVYVLFILFFAICLWITEAIPPFAVGIMIVGFLVFALGQPSVDDAQIDVGAFVNTWSDSVIWLLLGGFFLAEGMKKTGLDVDLFYFVTKRFNKSAKGLLLGIMLTTGIISMIMSNTATTTMMLAALMPLILANGKNADFSKALLLGVPAAASIGGMGTIIGSPPNAIAVDMINRLKVYDNNIDFLDWMLLGFPMAIILIIVFWFILRKKYTIPKDIDLSILPSETEFKGSEEVTWVGNWKPQRVMWTVLGVTVFLWITDGLHPIPMSAVSGIPIVILTMMNIVNAEDVRKLPWDTLMLVAGGLSLGLAIEQTGLMGFFLEQLNNLTMPLALLILSFAAISVFSSNIMSNTAAAAILIPAAALWDSFNPITLPLIIGLTASCALFLPVSTPPNAIAYSTGLLDQKEFRLGGISIGIIGPILISFWVLLLTNTIF